MAGEISFEQATAPIQRGEVSFEDASKPAPVAASKGTVAKGEISFEDAIGASSLPKETSDGIASHVDSILNPEPKPVPQRTKQTNAEFDQSIRDEQTPGAIAFRAAKQAGGNVLGSTAGLMDMFSGLLGMAISTGAYMGTRATALGAGEDNKLGAQAAALSAEHFTPEALSTPFRKVMNHLGYGETYDESSVGQAMQWISKQVESGSRSLSKETKGVVQPEDVSALANAAMLYFGVKGSSAALRNAALGRENVKWEKAGRAGDAQKYSELTKSFETTPEELHPADRTAVAFDATRDFNKWLDVEEAPVQAKGSIVVKEGYRLKATPGPGETGVSQIGTSGEAKAPEVSPYESLPEGTQPKVAGQWEGPGGTGDVTETTEVPGKMERFKELWRGDRRWTPRDPDKARDTLYQNLREYANSVVGSVVKAVNLVGSTIKRSGKDVDILYDLGDRELPKDSDEAAAKVSELTDGLPNADYDKYDSFFKVGDRYFHLSSGAGRDIVENTKYAAEQASKSVVRLDSSGKNTVPISERGSVDPKLLARMSILGTGAIAGAYADKDNPVIGAIIGGIGGAIATKAGRVALERWKSSSAEGRAATWLSNKLYTLTKQAQVRQIQALQYLSKIIPPDYKLHAEDIYHSMEDPSVKLSARARELRDLLVRPLQLANAKIRSSLEALGVDVGPEIERDYVHRVPVGQRSSIFEEMEKSYPTGRNLPKTAPSLKEREAYAIQTPSGAREIITVEGGNKFFVHRNGKIVGRGSYKPSSPEIKWGGQDWQKVQATTKEIEAHTEIRYYKDAVGTELDNNVRLSTALRNAQFLDKLKSMPSFGEVAAKFKDKSPADWRSVDIDQLKGYKFAPRVANTLDDFRGEMAKHPAETLGKISRILTGSMFWNPLPHIWNVLDHSIVQRGLSAWVSPQGYTRLWKTVGPAWKAVATQDASYLKFMHEGAGLMYPNVLLRDFSGKVMQQLGQVPEMGAVAKAFGYANPVEMVRRVYALSRKTLWAGNDVIMMQAYFEKQLQGAGVLGAIKQVEKHIPNYRIPDRVAGSRMISQVLQSPFFTAFGRYDYGRLASYGAMIKDAVWKSSSMATRAKALDQMAMLAVMGLVVYPAVLDKVAQAITGDPKAKAGRFGASTIPYLLYEYFHNKQELNQVVRSAMPIGPMLNSMLETYTNRDTFTGGKLFKSGQDAFSFVAKNVSPLYTATRVQQGKVTPKEAAFQSIGVRFPKTAEDLKRAKQQKALEKALGR